MTWPSKNLLSGVIQAFTIPVRVVSVEEFSDHVYRTEAENLFAKLLSIIYNTP